MRRAHQRIIARGRNNLRSSYSERELAALFALAARGVEWAMRRIEKPRFTAVQRRVKKRMRTKKRRALPPEALPGF